MMVRSVDSALQIIVNCSRIAGSLACILYLTVFLLFEGSYSNKLLKCLNHFVYHVKLSAFCDILCEPS
jgi:hypothetical protein